MCLFWGFCFVLGFLKLFLPIFMKTTVNLQNKILHQVQFLFYGSFIFDQNLRSYCPLKVIFGVYL